MLERSIIRYDLTIGKPLKLSPNMFVPLKNEDERAIYLEEYYDKNDANAYVFTEHQITFRIKMSSKSSDANKAQINIVNLDDDVVDYLTSNDGNKLVLTLAVGDNVQGTKEIFNGTIEKVEDDRSSENRMTTLTVLDGITNIANAKSVRRWPRGTPYQTVIQDLSNDMKVPVNRMAVIEGVTDSPKTLMGPTYKLMQAQLQKLGYNYSIDKGAAMILPLGKRLKKQVSLLTKETGLIGTVNPYVDDTKSTATGKSKENSGISFTCLIDGSLAPNETVYIQDGDYDGAYKITDIVFTGNYEGNDWTCSVIAVDTEGEIVDV